MCSVSRVRRRSGTHPRPHTISSNLNVHLGHVDVYSDSIGKLPPWPLTTVLEAFYPAMPTGAFTLIRFMFTPADEIKSCLK